MLTALGILQAETVSKATDGRLTPISPEALAIITSDLSDAAAFDFIVREGGVRLTQEAFARWYQDAELWTPKDTEAGKGVLVSEIWRAKGGGVEKPTAEDAPLEPTKGDDLAQPEEPAPERVLGKVMSNRVASKIFSEWYAAFDAGGTRTDRDRDDMDLGRLCGLGVTDVRSLREQLKPQTWPGEGGGGRIPNKGAHDRIKAEMLAKVKANLDSGNLGKI